MHTSFRTVAAVIVAAGLAAAPSALAQGNARRAQNAQVFMGRNTSYLGIGVVDIDAERAKALNLKEERGVEIKSVTEDSPAAKAGLKEGDVVLDYNGQPVQGTEQFQRLVRETPPGREVKLSIFRGGSTQSVTATLGTRKGAFFQGGDGQWSFTMPEPPVPPAPPVMPDIPKFEMTWRNPTLGIEGESMGAQLAEFFGVKEGVLVKSVIRNSAAEKAGIKAGDVITKVDDSNVTTTREISAVLRGLREKKTFTVTLVRAKKEMSVTVTIEERSSRGSRAGFVWFGDRPLVNVPDVVVDLPEIRLPEIRIQAHPRGEI